MPIIDPSHPLAKLLGRDKRYKFEAYVFVFEALNFAHETLGLGQEHAPEEEETPPAKPQAGRKKEKEKEKDKEEESPPAKPRAGRKVERHLTGQQLCEAIRRYALDQFGLMAKAVLNSWGITSTGDFGNIVFNLIDIGQMRKTKHDRREDFDNQFDFDTAFVRDYQITAPKAQRE